MGLTPWERQASMRHSRAHPSAHTHGLLRAPRKAQQTRHASRWQVYMHATLACGPVLHAGRLTLRDPLRPSATLCNPLRPSMTLCKPLRRPAQAQPRHGSACGPARACRTERGAYGGARRAQEGVGLQLRAQPARHCRLALDATPYSQTRTGLKPAALTQDPSAMTEPVGERPGHAAALCTSKAARGIQPQAHRARLLGVAAAGPGPRTSMHTRGQAERARGPAPGPAAP